MGVRERKGMPVAKRRRKNPSANKKRDADARGVHASKTLKMPSQETQAAEAITVFWMVSALAAVSAQALGLVLQLYMRQQEKPEAWLVVASRTLLLVAFVAGVMTLVLTPLVLRSRTVPPPRPIIVGAVLAGVMSLVTAFW